MWCVFVSFQFPVQNWFSAIGNDLEMFLYDGKIILFFAAQRVWEFSIKSLSKIRLSTKEIFIFSITLEIPRL